MKTKFVPSLLILLCACGMMHAQTNTLPKNGNVGIGTLSPTSTLQVIGKSAFGSVSDYAKLDSTGSLHFFGDASYLVDANKYVFRYSANKNYGLFFNADDNRYEFLDAVQRPVFRVHADEGNGYFKGGVQIGNTNETFAGNLRWTGKDFEGYNGNGWKSLTGKNCWGLRGNAKTNPENNFIGTTDMQPLIFKVNDTRSGYLSPENSNTTWGFETQMPEGNLATTAFGFNALKHNTGLFNTSVGMYAMEANTTGAQNTTLGANALRDNISGSDNTAIGHSTLSNNTTGGLNVGVGNAVLQLSTTANGNAGFGSLALTYNTTGNYNTATGTHALHNNTEGEYNVANGGNSLLYNTTGSENIGIGYQSMWSNISGSQNVSVGKGTAYQNISGNGNTAVGNRAGIGNSTGSNNTCIGNNAFFVGGSFSNSIALGYATSITANNQVRIGNSSITSIGGYANWSNISDGRYKKNIKENVPGLAFINALKPVTYNLDIKGLNIHLNKGAITMDDKSVAVKEQEIETGFIAQDVEKVAKKLGYQFSGVDAPKDDNDLYGLRYAEFVVPLVKAVQELSKKNDDKDAIIEKQQQQLNDMMQRLEALEKQSNISVANTQKSAMQSNTAGAKLEQNIPNPAIGNTVIRYNIPATAKTAFIIITDAAGHTVKQIAVNTKGVGQATVDTQALSAGAYFYTLMIDGKKADTKQMIAGK